MPCPGHISCDQGMLRGEWSAIMIGIHWQDFILLFFMLAILIAIVVAVRAIVRGPSRNTD